MAKIDKILGSISPAYGLVSGQGAFANLRKISPLMHMIGETDTKAEKRRKAEKAAAAGKAEAPEAGEGMKRGGKVKKAGGGAVQGPPASAPTAAASGGFDRNRLGSLNAPTASKSSPGMSVRPSFKKGMPGIKVKGSFAKGGSASSRGDGIAKKGKTKGKMR
jgi:hypothetical protein